MTEGIVGRKRPGFYMFDVLHREMKRIRWTRRDSLGKKQYKAVNAIKVITESGEEVDITLTGNEITFRTTFGGIYVRPMVANAVSIHVGELPSF